jgi:hypothetical protein
MIVYKASLTIAAINEALERDQGTRYGELLKEAVAQLSDAYRGGGNGVRMHLGASAIGRDCDRELWYSFRWALVRKWEARMLRLFNRGHLEEARFVALLRMIGVHVWTHDANGKQYRFSDPGGHFSGSTDGVIQGIPEAPDTALLVEYKTHSAKSFAKLVENGVRNTKFEHFVQMQIYMGSLGLPGALYLSVNKDDDDLYGELVAFDQGIYERNRKRAHDIIRSFLPPPRISQSPGWFQCKFCDYSQVCHFEAPLARSCRSCQSATPVEGGWRCERYGRILSKEDQIKACDEYLPLPR